MKESTLTGVLAGAAVVTAGLVFASFRILEGDAQFAEVLAVQPIVESVQKAREECPEELVVGAPESAKGRAVNTALLLQDAVAEEHKPNCRTVYDIIPETVGYDVVYRLGDRQGTVRMDHDPGERIPVEDGELILQTNPG